MFNTSSLSQPDSPRQNDPIMDSYYGGYGSLSQPNMIFHSPLASPRNSPMPSPLQPQLVLPTTTTAVVMTKTTENSGHLSPVLDINGGSAFLTTKTYSSKTSFENNPSNYYMTPSDTPKTLSPQLKDKQLDESYEESKNYFFPSINPSMTNSSFSSESTGKRKNSKEKRNRKKSVVHALENIIDPSRQSLYQKRGHDSYSPSPEKRFQEFKLKNGKKCKVIFEGQLNRWIEEDPFSIYSDDVTRFSTTPSSTVEQRYDVSFERIVSENNNGYWQKSNFLITNNEIVIFPNGKWDNKVIEVMTITDEINISISSILIAKLEWIIEVKNSENNVYTQSNVYYNNLQQRKDQDDKESKDLPEEQKQNQSSKDKKTHQRQSSTSSVTASGPTTSSSRQCKWILKFNDRESMLYFISLIKYIQTKKSKKLVNEEELGSLESSDLSSFSSPSDSSSEEDTKEQEGRDVEEEKSEKTKELNTIISPYSEPRTPKFLNSSFDMDRMSNYYSYYPSSVELTMSSSAVRKERKSSLGDRLYGHPNRLERRDSMKMANRKRIPSNHSYDLDSVTSSTRWSSRKNSGYGPRSTSLERANSYGGNAGINKGTTTYRRVLPSLSSSGNIGNLENLETEKTEGAKKSSVPASISSLSPSTSTLNLKNCGDNNENILQDSIRKAELEIMKLQDWRKNKTHSFINMNDGSNKYARTPPTPSIPNLSFSTEEKDHEAVASNSLKRDKEEKGTLNSPQLSWQKSNDRLKKGKVMSLNPNSSAALFTNIQLSYLDLLESQTKNKVIKLGVSNNHDYNNGNVVRTTNNGYNSGSNSQRNSTVSENESLPDGKAKATELSFTKEENPLFEGVLKKKGPSMLVSHTHHRRSSSLPQTEFPWTHESASVKLSPNSKSHPITIPITSPPSTTSTKFNSISPMDTGLSDTSSSHRMYRKGSITGTSNNSSFYSPRSSSLFLEEGNLFAKTGTGTTSHNKRISLPNVNIINSENKTNSILTNLSVSSDVAVIDHQNPKSPTMDPALLPYNLSLSFSYSDAGETLSTVGATTTSASQRNSNGVGVESKTINIPLPPPPPSSPPPSLKRQSKQSNVSYPSTEINESRSNGVTPTASTKSTPDLSQMVNMLRKNSLDKDLSIPPLNDGTSYYDTPALTHLHIKSSNSGHILNSNLENDPLTTDSTSTPSTSHLHKIHPVRSSSFYHSMTTTTNPDMLSSSATITPGTSDAADLSPNTTTSSLSRPRSSSTTTLPNSTLLSPLYRSSSIKTISNANSQGTINNSTPSNNRLQRQNSLNLGVKLDTNEALLMKLASAHLRSSSITTNVTGTTNTSNSDNNIINTDSDIVGSMTSTTNNMIPLDRKHNSTEIGNNAMVPSRNRNSAGSDWSKATVAATNTSISLGEAYNSPGGTNTISETNGFPYMMDIKASNELYLASLQNHIQQTQALSHPSTATLTSPLTHLPHPSTIGLTSPVLSTAKLPNKLGPYVHRNGTVSQPQSPLLSQIQPLFLNNTLQGSANSNPNPRNGSMDSIGSTNSSLDWNEEELWDPSSFLRPLRKKTEVTLDPIIVKSLEMLDILEQTYL